MKWIVVNLHPFASKRVPSRDVLKKTRSLLRSREVEIYYPACEDEDGNKIDNPQNDYIFIEYLENINYGKLEEDEFFRSILRDPTGRFHSLDSDEVFRMTPPVRQKPLLERGQTVLVVKGAYKGHSGVAGEILAEAVMVEVLSGDTPIDAMIPIQWLRAKV